MAENQGGEDLLGTTDCLEAVGVFKGWKNFLFLIVLLCLLVLQACFYLVDRGCISTDGKVSACEPAGQIVAEPNEPNEPIGTAEPNVPAEPNEAVEDKGPARDQKPAKIEEPSQPTEPNKPADLVKVAEPNEQAGLAECVEPNVPSEPNEPPVLDEPAEPNLPAGPGDSVEPNRPAEPDVATEPNEPADPNETAEPNEPADPNGTVNSGPVLWQVDAKVSVTTPRIQQAGQWFPKEFFSKITMAQLAWLIRLANAVLILAATLYCLTLLFSLKVSLNGRLGGINHISRAFFLSLLMLVVMLPWQKAFGSVLTGAIYTPEELIQWYSSKTDDVMNLALYYLRFSGYGALMTLLLILSQVRCMRWAKAILRRLDII